MPNQPLRVALLAGGDSSERSVSFSSASSVAAALDPEKYQVWLFDVASPATHEAQPAQGMNFPCQPLAWRQLITTIAGGFHVAFPMTHGGWGEDGTLQALLDVAGVRYVGSGPRACSAAMDKDLTKAIARTVGIATPRGLAVKSQADLADGLPFPGPCVVKPRFGGSSVGVTVLAKRQGGEMAEVLAAVALALADGPEVLIEEMIEGVEITCAVLGEGDTARSLPAVEIVPQLGDGFYDFEAKYAAGGSQHLVPPRLPAAVCDEASNAALAVYRLLGCRGVARADFIVQAGVPYFLEINTLPGMTATSLVPDAARAAGLEFPELLARLIADALK